jgi:hypothetical protein
MNTSGTIIKIKLDIFYQTEWNIKILVKSDIRNQENL